MITQQGAVTLVEPYYLTEDGIRCVNNNDILKLAEWQSNHDRIHLLRAMNSAYQLGFSKGWSDRKN